METLFTGKEGLQLKAISSGQGIQTAVCEAQQKFYDLEPSTIAGYVLIVASHTEGKIAVELGGNPECKHDMLEALIEALTQAREAGK